MSPFTPLLTYISSLPSNASTSVQHLTPYGWARLLAIVAVYLLIRPYLMRAAARGQERGLDEVVRMRPPGMREEGSGGRMEEKVEGSGTGRDKEGEGGGSSRRSGKGEGEGEGVEDDDDEAFLRRYCEVRSL